MRLLPPEPNAVDADLLSRIPLAAKTVLEVGCGTGSLAAEYKRYNPAVRYLGIEADPAAAEVAANHLDAVANLHVEREPLPFPGEHFDCIVYGGVLCRLRDPWTVLRRQAGLLAEHGTVVLAIPNLEHWSFTEQLLRGSWNYESHGLLDRAHVRWFTLPTVAAALKQAGLRPIDVWPRVTDRADAEAFVRAIEPGLAALGIDVPSYLRRAAAERYYWRAGRKPLQRIQVTSTMLDPVGGVSYVRVNAPLRALASDPWTSTRVIFSVVPDGKPEQPPKIFVFHRPLLTGEEGLAQVRSVIAAGYVAVCDFDDHPDYIKVLQQPNVQNFRAMHALQTSTEPLAEVLKRENDEIAVFPNAVERLETPRNFADPTRLTLFFAGLNREVDWQPSVAALNAVAAVAGERLCFHIVNDRRLFDALDTPHKRFTPLCDYDTYRALLAQSEFSFMPLVDGPFNRCKSDLKFIEAGACGVCAIASTVVYAQTIEDGQTGALFRDSHELQQRLLHLVANPGAAMAMGRAARDYVAANRMLAYQVERRLAWYRSLWARRDELHAKLVARVPELAQPA